MASVIIDTSSWIELAKPKFSNILDKLEEYVQYGQLEILMNDIIVEEWYRNKKSTTKNIEASIRSHAKSARKIVEFLEEPNKSTFENILDNYQANESIELEIANRHIERVEKFLNESTITVISEQLKGEMSERAVSKIAPFHNSKNNMADALIIFSAIEWVNEHKLIQTDLIFVSENYKEFGDPRNVNNVHPDIKKDSKKANIIFTNNIGRIIQVKEDNIEDGETAAEIDLWNHIYTEAEIRRGK